MKPFESDPRLAITASMIGAGLVTAQFLAGKAVRDALYLAHLSVASLPQIVIATAIVSIVLVFASAKLFRHASPATVIPWAFMISAALFVGEWLLESFAPRASARVVYLHVSGLGPMLGSGFWLIATEYFDPRTAKRRFGQIAGAGTAGGVVGALLAERVGAGVSIGAMLPILALLNIACAWQIRRLVRPLARLSGHQVDALSTDLAPEDARSGLRILKSAPYLRHLAALVLLGSVGAAAIDFVLKAEAAAAIGSHDSLLRYFAVFYAVTSVITFVVQMTLTRVTLERMGISFAAGTPSLALVAGGCGGLV